MPYHPIIGRVYLHNNKPCFIISGQFEVGGRISNFWLGKLIRKDGTLGKQVDGYGYDFENYDGKFKIIIKLT